jgi:hypothetical protein
MPKPRIKWNSMYRLWSCRAENETTAALGTTPKWAFVNWQQRYTK